MSVGTIFFVGWKYIFFCRLGKKLSGGKSFCWLEKKKVGKLPLPLQEMSGHSLKCRPKKKQKRKKPPLGPKGKKMSVGKKTFVGWKYFFLSVGRKMVGWKKTTVGWEKKCQLENFPWHSKKCPDIPWNADQKTAAAEKTTPRP